MKKILIFLVILVVGFLFWKYSSRNSHPSVPPSTSGHLSLAGEEKNSSTVTINNKTFQVALAKTQAEQQKGLGGVEKLEKNSGMLFIFPNSDKHGFWMKDTLIALDIIWIDADWNIVFIQKNATPDTYPSIFAPNTPALYVLEVNSGISSEYNFKIGDKVLFSMLK